MKEKESTVIDYLVGEVTSRLSSASREFLLKISILNAFCAPLCDAICYDSNSSSPTVPSQQYLQWIEKENLFIFPLDEDHIWYRFHQLFRYFLNQQLTTLYSSAEIALFHTRASQWFAQNRFFEEALRHALTASDTATAVRLAAQYRHNLRTQEQWPVMERFLRFFPPQVIESSPDLLMAEAWIMYARFQLEKIPGILDRIEALFPRTDLEPDKVRVIRSEIGALRSLQFYRAGDYQRALVCAQQSLKELPEELNYARVVAGVHAAYVYQILGNLESAYNILNDFTERIQLDANPLAYFHQQIGLCYVQWMAGDLKNLKITSANALALCHAKNLELNLGVAHYFLGIANYFQNNLAEAETHLANVFKESHIIPSLYVANSGFGLALTYRALGKFHKAGEIVEQLIEHSLKTNNTDMMYIAQMFQAEMSLLSGDVDAAIKVAMRFPPQPLIPMLGFYYPQFTAVKILLTQSTGESLQEAANLLAVLHKFAESTHNTRSLIDVLALESLLAERLGNEKSALISLKEALTLASSSGFVRNFLDMGTGMVNLVQRLDERGDQFIQQILKAFLSEAPVTTAINRNILFNHLTDREVEVLGFLAQRLSNKEIAAQLVISSGTVKSHTIRIYQKLSARNRRQAVEKALAIGIIT